MVANYSGLWSQALLCIAMYAATGSGNGSSVTQPTFVLATTGSSRTWPAVQAGPIPTTDEVLKYRETYKEVLKEIREAYEGRGSGRWKAVDSARVNEITKVALRDLWFGKPPTADVHDMLTAGNFLDMKDGTLTKKKMIAWQKRGWPDAKAKAPASSDAKKQRHLFEYISINSTQYGTQGGSKLGRCVVHILLACVVLFDVYCSCLFFSYGRVRECVSACVHVH